MRWAEVDLEESLEDSKDRLGFGCRYFNHQRILCLFQILFSDLFGREKNPQFAPKGASGQGTLRAPGRLDLPSK